MKKNATTHWPVSARALAAVAACGLLWAASPTLADDTADARFKGTGKADPVRISNVTVKPAGEAGVSTITFDLAWDWSWRAAWEADAAQAGGKEKLKLENWDAAWVFVKFHLPGANGWQHAILDANAASHTVPAGASLELGRSDDGKRGLGVFVYRSAVGKGPNDWKGVTLRWRHGAAVDPAAAGIKVLALQMVYVPQCAFWVGDGSTNHITGQFSAGLGTAPFRIASEQALTLGGETADVLNNRDCVGMSPSYLDEFHSDRPQALPAAFPKGYAAFYCMRHEITQQQCVDFLNTLSYAGQAARADAKPSSAPGTVINVKKGVHRYAIQLVTPGVADKTEPLVVPHDSFVASGTVTKPGVPAVYKTDAPHLPCSQMTGRDGAAFSAWAGLRPMTELEFEKACRGPLKPVPNEYAWGTDRIAGMEPKSGRYAIQNAGTPDETVVWEGDNGPDTTHGNAPFSLSNDKLDGPLRVGIFATPTSDRVASGASYWGILDLTGNLSECPVSVGKPAGRAFPGSHGDGGDSPWADLFFGMRGGGYGSGGHYNGWGGDGNFRISSRLAGSMPGPYGGVRHFSAGFRCVRTAPVEKK